MIEGKKKWLMVAFGLLIIGIVAFVIWQNLASKKSNIVSGNGRIEATEINISPRMPGQVKEMFVDEGDYVEAGQVLVQMDTDVLEAQLKEAQGKLLRARDYVSINETKLAQKKSKMASTAAVLRQREAEFEVAEKTLARSEKLVLEGATSQQTVDDDTSNFKSALAARNAALAQLETANTAIITAKAEVIGAEASVKAAIGAVEKIQAEINDSALKSPRFGRVQYRVVQPGEVVAAGHATLNLVDLLDVYMTFFLPTFYAGRITLGEEVRLILDAFPQYVIPAYISYVSDVAQFTPKTVETASEREKLMFRIKARIPKELLKKYITMIKTGLPGMAYIRINPEESWPPDLEANIS